MNPPTFAKHWTRTLRSWVGRVLLASVVPVSGCVPYPVYKQLQPETRVRVVDEQGTPVAGANVTLIATAYPYGREQRREVLPTGEGGVATFPSRREWRAESMMVHGWQEFFWNLCVTAPGRVTHLTAHRSASAFDTDATVVLARGVSTACPAPEREVSSR